MSSTPRSLCGYTSRGEAVFGVDEPNSRTYTPLPDPNRPKSAPVDPYELTKALLARKRTETNPHLLSGDLFTSDSDDASAFQSTHSLEWLSQDPWDHEFDLGSTLQQNFSKETPMQRTPPLSRRGSVNQVDLPPPPRTIGDRGGQQVAPAATATQATMETEDPRQRATAEAKLAVMTAAVTWEDDFDGLNPNDVPICLMRQKIDKIDELKSVLQSHEPRLSLAGPPTYPNDLKDRVNKARKGLSALSRALMKSLSNYEELNRAPADQVSNLVSAGAHANAPPAPPPGAAGRIQIIKQDVSMVTAQVDSMVIELDELKDQPTDEREYRVFVARSASAFLQIESIKVFARQVINDAASCNLSDEMSSVNAKLTELRTREDMLRTTDRRAKTKYGAVTDSSKEYITKPPSFSGDPDRGSDFFTFRRDWTEFKKQAHASESKLLHVLLTECLTGVAKTTCHELDSEKKVFKRLEKMFGNVSFLIQNKIEAIRQLKRCEGPSVKKREWLIEVSSKMTALRDLAIKHNKEEKVYHSTLTDHVTQSLPASWQEGFRAYAHKKHGIRDSSDDEDDTADEEETNSAISSLSMKSVYETLIKYLLSKVKKTTFDIDYELSVQKTRDERPKQAGPKPPPAKPTKSYAVVEAEPANEPPSSVTAAIAHAEQNMSKESKKKGSKRDQKGRADKKSKRQPAASTIAAPAYSAPAESKCEWCKGSHTHAYYCKDFQSTEPILRMRKVHDAQICFKCLRLDSKVETNREWFDKHKRDCSYDWVCTVKGCKKKPPFRQIHFLICGFHGEDNGDLLSDFMKQLDPSKIAPTVKFFTCYPIYFSQPSQEVPVHVAIEGYDVEPDIINNSIFMCHQVRVNGELLLTFYDSGCFGAGISDHAAKILKSTCIREGPTNMGVAGGGTVVIKHGDEQFALPLVGDRKLCLITGLRMDSITSDFPTWDVEQAWPEIFAEFQKAFPGGSLPDHPAKIGGRQVDIMLGIRYIKHFPTLLYTLPSGLALFESKIAGADGQNLVLGGPHSSWNHAASKVNIHTAHVFFSQEMRAFYHSHMTLTTPMSLMEPEVAPELDVCQQANRYPCLNSPYQHTNHEAEVFSAPQAEVFNVREAVDRIFSPEIFESEINYRCMRCRNCSDCRNSDRVTEMSLKDEKEQYLIDQAVTFDKERKMLFSALPFIQDPDEFLKPNRHIAESILSSQLKITSSNETIKSDMIGAHEKLRSRKFVQKLSEMDHETQRLIDIDGPSTKYYIPWRMQWKPTSLSSPGRMVFDASSATPKGKSLNCILAKGENRLSKLFHVLLKFRAGAEGFTADITMAYNNLWLKPEYLKYHLYLWKENLDEDAPTEVFVVRTLIYGVRPSGNLMLAGFKLLSDYCLDMWPEHERGAAALGNAYVDDLLHAARNKRSAKEDADSLLFVLNLAQMTVKGFTFSGRPPPTEVSPDGATVGLLGMVWEPEPDLVSVDAKPVFFGRVRRGRLPELVTGDLKTAFSTKFTKRMVLAKMATLFDPMGLLAPLTAKFKLGFSTICGLKTDWDEPLPSEYLDEWVGYLKEIQAAKQLKLPRSVIPPNAASTDIEVIVSADASQWVAACCAHARVPLVGGGYGVQLLCSRTKITKDLTIPKAEMRAMTMAAGMGHMIKQQLGDQVKAIMYITDSTIALCQLNLDSRPMETMTRNCVIEIRRLTNPADWYHVESENNVADLATRTAGLSDVEPGSAWQTGKSWMCCEKESMPLRTVSQIIASSEAKRLGTSLCHITQTSAQICSSTTISPKVKERYKIFNYLYDPNKYGWVRATRVMGYVCKFVKMKCPSWAPEYAPPPPPRHSSVPVEFGRTGLTRYDLRFGQHYFYYLATLEVKAYTELKKYENDTFLRYGILFHAGRILDGHQIDTPVDRFIDMEPLSFVKPVADRYSPIAYSVMLHAHSSIENHRTASATLTESRSIMFIFQGRSLANEVRQSCQECRVYKLKLMEVEMSPLSPYRLTIAPPFFISQVDLAGPFNAHSEHNLRAVVKVWLCVFKCTTSCAVTAHVITKYSTAAVLSAYTRFAKSYGHPGLLLIDQGTQLMSACTKMELSIYDLTNTLNCKFQVGVEHRVCPARAHNYQGMVERSIAEIKRVLNKVTKSIKLDIIGYETAAAWITNDLNNLPIALGSRTDNLDNMDIITPSRLLLGRNNRRAMSGYPRVDGPSRMMKQQDELYQLWWDVWRKERLADFIPQPNKWRNNTTELGVGDIVAFIKEETGDHHGKPLYKVGRVISVERSADGLIRTCTIQYKNAANPTLFLETRMSVRHVGVIHSENDLDLIQQLNSAAKTANELYLCLNSKVG